MCKLIESIIKDRIKPVCDKSQNPYQRGFTENASPLNAALIIEEFLRETKDNNSTAHVVFLDAKSAFDVANHDHLLRKLYHAGVQDKHWTLISSLHENAASAVKWYNQVSDTFNVSQGVRQGGILSADLYKLYLNPLMDRIQLTKIGARIGNILCNQSGCADDMTLNSNEKNGLQILTDIAVYYSDLELYLLQIIKSVVLTVEPTNTRQTFCTKKITMKDKERKQVNSATHLGIKRSTSIKKTRQENVEDNIKKARRTAYSLMPCGFHGHNGLDIETKIHLLKTYVIPVLLYGLEVITPNKTLVKQLETYKKKL